MLYYGFHDYNEFKELFGKCSSGTLRRKNKVLLAFLKSRELVSSCRNAGDYGPLRITSMAELEGRLICELSSSCGNVKLERWTFVSEKYGIDELQGLSSTCDPSVIRYVNLERGKVCRMKASKFFHKIIDEHALLSRLPFAVRNYLADDVLAKRWEAFAAEQFSGYELHVDDDFEKIYSVAGFGSCMTQENYHSFYEDCVNARAAYLTDKDGVLVARAVIFDEVTCDCTGETFRLCERQYSAGSDLRLQRILVNKLIAGGYIDGYKKIGAGCHEADAFVANDGTDMSGCCLSIACDIPEGHCVSYQDSFKWYDRNRCIAYNYSKGSCNFILDTTDGYIDYDDDYHGCYCDEVVNVHYRGSQMSCDIDNLDDFMLVGGEWWHVDECCCCEECGEWYVEELSSADDSNSFCCRECEITYEIREHAKCDEYYIFGVNNGDWDTLLDEDGCEKYLFLYTSRAHHVYITRELLREIDPTYLSVLRDADGELRLVSHGAVVSLVNTSSGYHRIIRFETEYSYDNGPWLPSYYECDFLLSSEAEKFINNLYNEQEVA